MGYSVLTLKSWPTWLRKEGKLPARKSVVMDEAALADSSTHCNILSFLTVHARRAWGQLAIGRWGMPRLTNEPCLIFFPRIPSKHAKIILLRVKSPPKRCRIYERKRDWRRAIDIGRGLLLRPMATREKCRTNRDLEIRFLSFLTKRCWNEMHVDTSFTL